MRPYPQISFIKPTAHVNDETQKPPQKIFKILSSILPDFTNLLKNISRPS